MKYIQIHWTCANIDEARTLARQLVEQREVACATIIPGVHSIYVWNNSIEEDQEVKVIFKTCDNRFLSVKKFILENASYEVPEIVKICIDDGSEDYLHWLEINTR